MPEQIITSEIGQKVGTSFLNYANAVIEDRALPNILDGLKPVQRRILYSLHELGLEYNKPHRKVAKVVGHCLGNFHPHSDASVADALTNMGRDFACRYPLIDGHGRPSF